MTAEAFVYLAIVPSLVICLFAMSRLYYIRKHDVVLFRFCQIRREMMSLLRTRGEDLPKRDYDALRLFLKTINDLIQGYSHYKFRILNIRRFAVLARKNARQLKNTREVEFSDDKEIRELQVKTVIAIARGFFSYTPFLRSEIAIRVLAKLSTLVGKLGSTALKAYSQQFLTTLQEVQLISQYKPNKHGPECRV